MKLTNLINEDLYNRIELTLNWLQLNHSQNA